MKIYVKTLKGIHFQIEVNPNDTIGDVKKNIESVQGASVYPASKQMLIYQGRALTDATTLEQNKVSENSFIVVMLCKSKIFSGESSAAAAALPTPNSKSSPGMASVAAAATPASKSKSSSGVTSVAAAAAPASKSKSSSADSSVAAAAAAMPISKSKSSSKKTSVPAAPTPTSKSKSSSGDSSVAAADMPTSKIIGDSQIEDCSGKSSVKAAPMPTSKFIGDCLGKSSSGDGSVAAAAMPTPKAPATPKSPSVEECITLPTTMTNASVPASVSKSVPSPIDTSSVSKSNVGGQAASNLVGGNGLENTIQHILDMGGGIWDRDTVVHALHAASNNPERAVEFLCSGIPEQAEAGQPKNASTVSQQPTQPATVPPSQQNAGPLNILPEGLPTLGALSGPLDFLRNSEKFQALRAMVQSNPETLQPMLQEFGKQNPNLMRLIQEHQAEFQRLLNEPVAGEQGNILEQYAAAMPQSIQVTPKEHAAIERLEAMGFDRSTVLEAYFACNKSEELTANYLLDHIHEFED